MGGENYDYIVGICCFLSGWAFKGTKFWGYEELVLFLAVIIPVILIAILKPKILR